MEPKTEPVYDCCPPFDPTHWDNQMLDWTDKKFIKDHVRTLFYRPLNFGRVMRKLDKKVKDSEAKILDWMVLADHTSRWNMDLYLAVDKEIPDAENTRLSGHFFSKVYEGPFKDAGKWCNDYEEVVKEKGLKIKKWYMWYTTCPNCAKKYGKNYVDIVAEIE
ncbi:hydrolase [Mangrovibacterium lignilyticum]|uniref:hydrolase n=1 Tax=Mangrovibacterium lignilyticum TaxID=2668052 RepID=UPI0013D8406B|nr:hydrolase [Mangrovibacterium lignilyticum]